MNVFMTDAEWSAFVAVTRPEQRPPRALVFESEATS